jgi:transposase
MRSRVTNRTPQQRHHLGIRGRLILGTGGRHHFGIWGRHASEFALRFSSAVDTATLTQLIRWKQHDRAWDRRSGLSCVRDHGHAQRNRRPGCADAFRGKRGDRLKLLYFDGHGFCLYYKILQKGRFPWPSASDGTARLMSAQLAIRRLSGSNAAQRRSASGPS